MWKCHFGQHIEGTKCVCGFILTDSSDINVQQAVCTHRIWATDMGAKNHKKETKLLDDHFPPPFFSLEISPGTTTPPSGRSTPRTSTVGALAMSAPSTRTSKHFKMTPAVKTAYNLALADLDAIVPPAPESAPCDGRFRPIIALERINVPVEYGYCMCCVFDATDATTYTSRMSPFTSSDDLHEHFMKDHLFPMWFADKEEPPTVANHVCPDPSCSMHTVKLTLWQWVNHAVLHHQAFTSPDPIHMIIADADELDTKPAIMAKKRMAKGTRAVFGIHSYLLGAGDDDDNDQVASAPGPKQGNRSRAAKRPKKPQSASSKAGKAKKKGKAKQKYDTDSEGDDEPMDFESEEDDEPMGF
ncbi:uncharacterized protein EHS24_006079 [Apiotrichum porosum]|uniref:Uncharacterized protein n=1 Tax=Apiotrichum porosum TaxID=105984 RepID=A0A427Y0D7_9TREE|nr:uncharacterized protein EHS24_006079 [Apiotrichum porosum]RSH84557.1 hypothetical protein EHS24_006079 [Apiotrichum porosum]